MSTGLEVIAVGARTPIGLVAQTAAAAARAGICRIREYPFVTVSGEPMMMASDAKLPATLEGAERLVPLARCVLEEVAHELAAAPRPYRGHVDPWLSLPEARPGMPERDIMRTAETLAAALRASGTPLRCDVAGRGHAGVALAVERTAQTNVRGEEHLTVILGVDSYLHPETFVWLEGNRSFGPDTRSGFAPGEGAGCLVLASTRLRKSLGLPCLAVVGGVATAQEHRLPGSETGSLGEGMTAAVFGAISGLRLPTEAVDTVYCDINGERYRSEEWGFVALRASATFRAPEYEAPADCWGDMGAASGALFGPSGSPPNSATLMGVIQMSGMVTVIEDEKCPICGEDHRFEESEATKLDAGALAGNFKGQVAAAAAAGAAKDPPVKVSANTMLGVVHCKCGKKYADQSAMTTVELCRAAAAAGMKHLPGVTVSYADGRGALDAAYLETLDRVKKGIGGHLGNSELFQDTWEKAEDRAKDSDENRSGPAAVVVHDHDPPVAGVCSRPWPTLGAGCSR
ncbi:hypothetical protein, partial [Paraliomyxa miuraensis]|uniref:hypothetical protein n=1 Tax=Paraliomyxa miuraensis TaxID=376150 RepID=UPI002253BAD4